MPRFLPPRRIVVSMFFFGIILTVGGSIYLVIDTFDYADAQTFPGVVNEHHAAFMPYEPGSAKVFFWFNGIWCFDTIETAPSTSFEANENVTLFYAPKASRRLQIKGVWQQYWIEILALGLGIPMVGIGWWGIRQWRRYPDPDFQPVHVPRFGRGNP